MNKHLNDGQLRAALDGELEAQAQRHLDSCSACQARQHSLQTQVAATAHKLAFLTFEQEKVPSPQTSLKHFYSQKLFKKEIFMLKKI